MMEAKTCCVTGHRKIAESKIGYVKQELRREIIEAITDGYLHYISGFADGVDLWFAEIVLELKREHPNLTLEAAVPYRKRLQSLYANEETTKLLVQCSAIGVHSEGYDHNCFIKRNRFMVQCSSRVIAVYDGRETGGTVFTMREAAILQRDVRIIKI